MTTEAVLPVPQLPQSKYTASSQIDSKGSILLDKDHIFLPASETISSLKSPACPQSFPGPKSTFRKSLSLKIARELDSEEERRGNDLKKILSKSLRQYLVRKKLVYDLIEVACLILANEYYPAEPWLLISCDREILDVVQRFFKKREVVDVLNADGCPKFNALVNDRAKLAYNQDDDDDLSECVEASVEMEDPDNACGMNLRRVTDGTLHYGKLGGIIAIHERSGKTCLYGSTLR